MKRLFSPIVLLLMCIILNRATMRIAPFLIGIETLQEQVNGLMPVGMLYVTGLETIATIFNISTIFCLFWLITRIFNLIKERTEQHEKL